MRSYILLLALLAFVPAAHAADKSTKVEAVPLDDATPAADKNDAAQSDDAAAAKDEQTTAPAGDKVVEDKAPDEKADAAPVEKPKVDWVDVESTGTLQPGKGGLDKTLWKGQKRTDIEFLLAKLPTTPYLRTVISLQRRLLLSKTDFSLINNDVGPLRGNDFLIQRINKLMDMGLYDDAWSLYAEKAENPYDVSVAQLGMVLLIMRNDLATACLEEKAFGTRYKGDKVFSNLDRACAQTLGSSAKPSFPDSKVLQSVYNDAAYTVAATNVPALEAMSDMERALVLANGKIRYDGLSKDILAKTPSTLLTLYMMDKNLPEAAQPMVRAEITARGLAPYVQAMGRDEFYVKAKAIHDDKARWEPIESALAVPGRVPGDMKMYADFLSLTEPADLSTDTLIKSLSVLLAADHALPDFWRDAAVKAAPQNPLIYIYLQAFASLTPTKIPTLKQEDVLGALGRLKPQETDQIIAILDTLDNDAGFGQKSLNAYDKHLGLTLENNYVMPTVGLNILLETAPEQKQTGITVLAVLNSLAAKPDNMYSGSVRKALYSMLNVGLLEDAKQIGAETIASVLNKY